MNLSLNQLTIPDLPFEEAVEITTLAGFSGIGLLRDTLRTRSVPSVSKVLARWELTATSVCVALGIVDRTASGRRRLLARAAADLHDATALGVPLVVVVGGPQRGLSYASALQQASEGLSELAGLAQEIGGRVLVEPLNPVLVAMSVLSSFRDAVAMVERLPEADVVLDTWHVWAEHGLRQSITDHVDRIAMVHLADCSPELGSVLDRVLPGEGISSLATLCRHIDRSGFRGWWEVEVPSQCLRSGDQRTLPARCYAAASTTLAALSKEKVAS